MSCKTSLKISYVSLAALVLAAVATSLGAQSATAASHHKRVMPMHHRLYNAYPTPRLHPFAGPATLPYGPEYGFLRHVPPNAIRTPGYTFVPGVGILGESCDMPTSACTNEYRDIQ
jgi:hypothetical protein